MKKEKELDNIKKEENVLPKLTPIKKMMAKLKENEKMSPTIILLLDILKELDEAFFLGSTHVQIVFDRDGSYFTDTF